MAIKLSSINSNPDNPRIIKDERFRKLCNSIREFSKMMELRPIIIDDSGMILGGNMRLAALKELGYKEIPNKWVKKASDLTDEEKQRFIIADNVGFGEWDWGVLANDWDNEKLEDWGLDVPHFKEPEEPSGYDQQLQWFLNIRCDSEQQAQKLYERFVNEGLEVKIVT